MKRYFFYYKTYPNAHRQMYTSMPTLSHMRVQIQTHRCVHIICVCTFVFMYIYTKATYVQNHHSKQVYIYIYIC